MRYACPVKGCRDQMNHAGELLCSKHLAVMTDDEKAELLKARRTSRQRELVVLRQLCAALETR